MEEGTWLCKDQKGERARSWKATKQACREKATSNIPGSGSVEEGQNLVTGQTWNDSWPSTEMTGTEEGAGMGLLCEIRTVQCLGELPAVSGMGYRDARKRPAGVQFWR